MYNRYIRNDAGRYERIPVEEAPPPPPDTGGPEPPPVSGGPGGFPPPPGGGPASSGKGLFSGILEKLNLKDILFREGGDEELLIALGLLLIL